MPRLFIAAVLLLAACSRGSIDTTPSPVTTASRPAATNSLADAMLLDSLVSITADREMPPLTLEEVAGPSWDINVEGFVDHPRVQYYIEFFTGRGRNGFQSWLHRMPRYEGYARARLAEQGLPGDLVYLALIESGFSPVAVSRARAVGMWQFMQATGRGYGLRVDAWLDERRDPIKSTDAAARHLKDLTNQFGSHFLAAAAYNGGAGRVGRGVTRITALAGSGEGTVDPSSDEMFFELAQTPHLFQETKDYVPKLIAAALIAKDPERYGFEVPGGVEPFPLDSVIVDGSTGLDLIARLAKVDIEEIRALNPHILRGYTPPGMRYPVRVPNGTAATISTAYAEIPPSERVTMVTHTVRRGETLSGIASRYGLSTELLQSANSNVRPRSLQVGAVLNVPVSGTAAAAASRQAPVQNSARVHLVRSGDTVSAIAARYGVSQSAVIRENRLDSRGRIKVGQRLRIPG